MPLGVEGYLIGERAGEETDDGRGGGGRCGVFLSVLGETGSEGNMGVPFGKAESGSWWMPFVFGSGGGMSFGGLDSSWSSGSSLGALVWIGALASSPMAKYDVGRPITYGVQMSLSG